MSSSAVFIFLHWRSWGGNDIFIISSTTVSCGVDTLSWKFIFSEKGPLFQVGNKHKYRGRVAQIQGRIRSNEKMLDADFPRECGEQVSWKQEKLNRLVLFKGFLVFKRFELWVLGEFKVPDCGQSAWAAEVKVKDTELRSMTYEGRYQWVTHMNAGITQEYWKEDSQQWEWVFSDRRVSCKLLNDCSNVGKNKAGPDDINLPHRREECMWVAHVI